jgi:hypothetical protein
MVAPILGLRLIICGDHQRIQANTVFEIMGKITHLFPLICIIKILKGCFLKL